MTADLVESFWRRVPARVGEATGLWLAVEAGESDKMRLLRRLVHTIKGEAHMLALTEMAEFLELTERVIDELATVDELPQGIGDTLLGALEAVGLMAASRGSGETLDLGQVRTQLGETAEMLSRLERRSESQGPAERPSDAAGTSDAESPLESSVGAREIIQEIQPALHELQRLQGERHLLEEHLRELHRMLRALLVEIDPKLSAAALKERIVKTLGYGSELERRFSSLRVSWSENSFASGLMLERMAQGVQRGSLVSLEEIKQQIHLVARSTAQALGKSVQVQITGDAWLDTGIEQRLRACLLHLIRNAVDHGIEATAVRRMRGKLPQGHIKVSFSQTVSSVEVSVEDDGAGVDFDKVRTALGKVDRSAGERSEQELLRELFEYGVTTRGEVTEISGRGVGLDVVLREAKAVGGDVQVDTKREEGTRFTLTMPLTLRADLVVSVKVRGLVYAFPSRAIHRVFRIEELVWSANGPHVRLGPGTDADLAPVFSLAAALHGDGQPEQGELALVLQHRAGPFAVTVEDYGNPRPITFQRIEDLVFDSGLARGVAPLAAGGVLYLLDVDALRQILEAGTAPRARQGARSGRHSAHVLVVEDAPVARELLVGILRSFGLRVSEATDGHEGLLAARRDPPDLVLSDIEMPFLDGLQMIGRFQGEPRLRDVPVIVLTTRIDKETQARAHALGVRGFLSKQKFVEEELRKVIDDCLKR